MRKSDLQKEFRKQLRQIEKQLKELQKFGKSFDVQPIEAIKRRRTSLHSDDIERLIGISSEIETRLAKVKHDEIRKGRRKKADEYISRLRQKLSEEEKKERRNFRARVRRLEKQGYDISAIGKASEYNLDTLKQLKGSALSSMAYKDGKTAYQDRKEKANEKRKETIESTKAFRDRVMSMYSQTPVQEMENIKPTKSRELGDYVDIGQGSLVHFKDLSVIEFLTSKFQSLENVNKISIEAHKESLLSLFYDILTEHDDETGEGISLYEDYLRAKEPEIIELCEKINYDSSSERIDMYFSNLFAILNNGALDMSQSRRLSDISETIDHDYTE